jgi:hypothetical protein
MYEAPTLEEYGTLREVTQGGGAIPFDTFDGDADADGCYTSGPQGSKVECDPNQ